MTDAAPAAPDPRPLDRASLDGELVSEIQGAQSRSLADAQGLTAEQGEASPSPSSSSVAVVTPAELPDLRAKLHRLLDSSFGLGEAFQPRLTPSGRPHPLRPLEPEERAQMVVLWTEALICDFPGFAAWLVAQPYTATLAAAGVTIAIASKRWKEATTPPPEAAKKEAA